jgi:uncharacterized membrane protein YoaK (UPF0700 family)
MATAVRSSPQAAPAFPLGRHLLSDPRHGPLPPLLLLLTAVTGLVDAAGSELALVATALAVAASATALTAVPRDSLAALLAVAMGIQNAAARRLAVPDLTTTVLTMTLTGIAADLHARDHGPALLRRVLAVATMLAGGAAAAWLVLRIGPAAALGLAAALLALVTAGAMVSARRPGTWRAGTP